MALPREGASAVRAETARPAGGLNWVLQRQLSEARRDGGELDLDAFIRIVSRHYDMLDEERAGVVRSMQMMSEEAQALARDALASSPLRTCRRSSTTSRTRSSPSTASAASRPAIPWASASSATRASRSSGARSISCCRRSIRTTCAAISTGWRCAAKIDDTARRSGRAPDLGPVQGRRSGSRSKSRSARRG